MSVSRRSVDLVVVSPLNDWTCAACESTDGGWLVMEDRGPVCMSCADLAHLVFLPPGDAALTRRARKHSGLSAVLVRFSRAQALGAPGRAGRGVGARAGRGGVPGR
jgi:hypothetical protein